MENEFGFKELEKVVLKTTFPLEAGGKHYEEGEVIAEFDKIQIAGFREKKDSISARGGFDNRALVTWETTKEIDVTFSQGVFSKTQFALMSGGQQIPKTHSEVKIHTSENLQTDEDGILETKYPVSEKFFIYDLETKEKVKDYTLVEENKIKIEPMKEYKIDYNYLYKGAADGLIIGRPFLKGYVSLEGRTRFKDDETGHVKTGIIKIPRLKIMSDLSISMGKKASPIVGVFKGVACPVGERNNQRVLEIYYLDDDIDSDF